MKRIAATFAIAAACTLSATAVAKTYSQTGQVEGSSASSVVLKVKVSGKGVIKKVAGFTATDVMAECKGGDGEPPLLSFESDYAIPVDKKTKKFSGGDRDFTVEGKVKKKGKKVVGTLSAPPFVPAGQPGGHVRCSLPPVKFQTS